MPNSQPLPTRLHNDIAAIALEKQPLYVGPDEVLSQPFVLAENERVTVVGEPAIGAGRARRGSHLRPNSQT